VQQIEIYQIDAFTDKVFYGNPAAICLLDEWLNHELLQAIASENNLSETAFIIGDKDVGFQIRWFTPNGEVNLCGHATLAAAFLLIELKKSHKNTVEFSTLGGKFKVHKKGDLLTLIFPRLSYSPIDTPHNFVEIIDQPLQGVFSSTLDYLVVLSNEKQVMSAQIDLTKLARLPKRGLILTAKSSEVDFYSRCFYPKHHIAEDPVTGSAHSVLAPYWGEQLDKTKLHGRQGLMRRGDVFCEVFDNEVALSGRCRWYSKGHLIF
jgi:PhzF family phenazine biosynthesis protein